MMKGCDVLKFRLTRWFKDVALVIGAGVCPTEKLETTGTYPDMEVRINQKDILLER